MLCVRCLTWFHAWVCLRKLTGTTTRAATGVARDAARIERETCVRIMVEDKKYMLLLSDAVVRSEEMNHEGMETVRVNVRDC